MGWCVPACVEMTLKYLNNCHGPGIECLSQIEIAKLCGTTEGGTQHDAVVNLNAQTERYIPSVDFRFVKNQTLKDVNRELSQNLPVIAFVQKRADNDKYPHAVLITGLNTSGDRIQYNDPMGKADEQTDIGKFMDMWAKDFCAWFISLGVQRKLDEANGEKR